MRRSGALKAGGHPAARLPGAGQLPWDNGRGSKQPVRARIVQTSLRCRIYGARYTTFPPTIVVRTEA